MGETRVDLLHLLEDLRDAYPGATEETILTEIVANSLDSRAATIAITTDPAQATTLVDDGMGMRRRELARYHDIAASAKVRGQGIGFAGVGIKIGLLVCREVLTETRLGKQHIATSWALATRHRAPWKWVPPAGLLAQRGTAVRMTLSNPLSPLLDPGFIETTCAGTSSPFSIPPSARSWRPTTPHAVGFVLNGATLDPQSWDAPETAAIAVRLARKRKPSAAGYMIRDTLPLPEERQGLAVSTFGKVIKRGWDWLGLTPAAPERVGGLIEVPALAECLTLNKADFIRAGSRGATYLAFRKAVQEVVSRQLAAWGDSREPGERARLRAARPAERDLETVLMDLADQFPLLSSLVEHRAGGQRRLPTAGAGRDNIDGPAAVAAASVATPPRPGSAQAAGDVPGRVEPPEPAGVREPSTPASEVSMPAAPRARRPARYGLSIQFERRPDDSELARLVESTVWVNEAHPAYRRALASRSEGYHIALASGLALAPLAVEPAKEHAFITAFLAAWGAAVDRRTRGRQR